MATKITSSHQLAKLKKQQASIKELANALSNLLFVINREDDNGGGGWFICEEAIDVVDNARDISNKYNKN